MAFPSIWLVGCGNMGGAMLKGWLASGIAATDILVIDPAAHGLPDSVASVAQAPEVGAPETLVLAIKPQMLAEIGPRLTVLPSTTVISILAGVEVQALSQTLPGAQAYVRVMPNMPAAIGEGISVVFGPNLDGAGRARVESLVAPLGHVEWVVDEALFHGVTGVSGSGPAYVLRFAEALAAGGVREGLPPALSLRLALETLAGSARLALASNASPGTLVESVRSPNGTTHAGLSVMDVSNFTTIVADTVSATANRSRELAAAARKA